ncbi:MAG: TIGR00730 family Rossman fold protein [Sulfurimonas sp.]|uniref:LOG family protein n=1 Tax=Sulfurimonas sp. TaxID=2022749 RepID=UPI00262A253D|nr:TIGR00730 family Rossman fold protein [Sulfurimonas sp.]MCW8896207.1 TIGR00730 family Rossman fold protein [Sulfurimonas sp.]MCW8954371.1 TIGR00730 family Rossman fold protein [Sulfurimonas sp.]MCW9067228.1 TIGR00730 family Rossman fold protein [Sulfurimonas sp.]
MKKNNKHKVSTQLHIPQPPKAKKRKEKLPCESLKSIKDEPQAVKRVENLMKSPSYRAADRDPNFLRDDSVRGVRLQIDYLKAELLLQEHGVEQTIVVFGGTRIVEKAEASRNYHEAKESSDKDQDNKHLAQKLKAAINILDKSHYYDIARDFGKIVGNSGKGPSDCKVTIMTGGGPGIMEAANRGAFDVGAKSIGLNITLPKEQFPNPYISPELCFKFHYFSMRKLHFLKRAKALVAFPGGFGTIDELMEALTLIQTRKISPIPIILVGEEFWKEVINFDYLLNEGVIDAEDMELFWYAQSAEEIWDSIIQWHVKNGQPLL